MIVEVGVCVCASVCVGGGGEGGGGGEQRVQRLENVETVNGRRVTVRRKGLFWHCTLNSSTYSHRGMDMEEGHISNFFTRRGLCLLFTVCQRSLPSICNY